MAEGRLRSEWGRTSSIMWLIAEVNRDPKRRKRPFRPADFDPYARGGRRQRRTSVPVSVDRLADEMMRVAEAKKGRKS